MSTRLVPSETATEQPHSPNGSVTGFFQSFAHVADFLHRVSQEGAAGDIEVSAVITDQGVIRVIFTGLEPRHVADLSRASEAVVAHALSGLRRHLELTLPKGMLVPGDETFEELRAAIGAPSEMERRNPRPSQGNDEKNILGLTGNASQVEHLAYTVSLRIHESGKTGPLRINPRYLRADSNTFPLEYSLGSNTHVQDSSPEVGTIVRISIQGASGTAVGFVGKLIHRLPIRAFSIEPVQRIPGTPKHDESQRHGGTVEDVVVCVEASCGSEKLEQAIHAVFPVNLADVSVKIVPSSLVIQHAQIILPRDIASQVQQSLSQTVATRLRPSPDDTSRIVMTVTGCCEDVREALQRLNNQVPAAFVNVNAPVLTLPTSTIGTPKKPNRKNAIAY